MGNDFNHYPFVTYIYNTHLILTEIIIIFKNYGMTTQLNEFLPLYSCNNITLMMAGIAAEACW